MEKINLYIDSKNKKTTEKINNININLPNGLLNINRDEYFILNVNSFHTFSSWYNSTTSNSSYQIIFKDETDVTTQILYYTFPIGNLNVNDIKSILENSISAYIITNYDKIKNKFIFKRNPLFLQDQTNIKIYLSPINWNGNNFYWYLHTK